MRIQIIPKEDLNEQQIVHLRERVAADEHRFDKGPCHQGWDIQSCSSNIFVVILSEVSEPIGILYRGGPKQATTVAWWLDQIFRGQSFGHEMIDLFANTLKKEGVTGIGQLVIDTYQGRYNGASESLARRLKAHFAN